MRVHALLEHWGLINFNVEPHLRVQRPGQIRELQFDRILANAASGFFLNAPPDRMSSILYDF